MYARLHDELLHSPKLAIAGHELGRNGQAIALGFYTVALMWCNEQLTDGEIPYEQIDCWRTFVSHPRSVADALVKGRLFDETACGYRVHNFRIYNISSVEIKARRLADKLRKRIEREQKHGNGHA